jgi:hypothetical protein
MKTFYQTLKICGILLGLFLGADAMAQLNLKESQALIGRVIPQRAQSFVVESLSASAPKDLFEIESKNNKIILRGNNGVSVASALYYYLTEYCHCQITWNGENLDLPTKLPQLTQKSLRLRHINTVIISTIAHSTIVCHGGIGKDGKKKLTGWRCTALICHWLLQAKNIHGEKCTMKWVFLIMT